MKAACEDGRLARLKGFGDKTAQKILDGIKFLDTTGQRVRYSLARPLGEALLTQLKALPGVVRAELCGSLRRGKETVKDIDIVLSSATPQPIMDAFVALPEVVQVTAHGPTKSSVVASLTLGHHTVVMNADLRVVPDAQFPVTVLHFTGSKEHNIRLRQRAIERDLSLNDYALTAEDVLVPVASEADIYSELGPAVRPPGDARGRRRDRTGRGEVDPDAHRAGRPTGRFPQSHNGERREWHPRRNGGGGEGARLRVPRHRRPLPNR